jgi:hypothetical protein
MSRIVIPSSHGGGGNVNAEIGPGVLLAAPWKIG